MTNYNIQQTLVYIYFFLVFILVSSYGQEIIYRQWGCIFGVLYLGSHDFQGEREGISCRQVGVITLSHHLRQQLSICAHL